MSSEANHNNLLCSHTDLYPLQYLAPAKTLRLTPAASNFSRPNRNSARCVSKRAYFGASLVVDAPACSGRQNLLSVSVTSSAELDECEYPLPAPHENSLL